MRFAIPLAEGKMTQHFGHCAQFAIIDTVDGKVTAEQFLTPPPHEPGVLPKWLGEEIKVNTIIAGGMGMKAQTLFANYGVKVLVGALPKDPKELIADYFANTLVTGANACDH